MKKKKKVRNRGLLGETWSFIVKNKSWWLVPLAIMLVLVALLIILGASTPVSPFVYALI